MNIMRIPTMVVAVVAPLQGQLAAQQPTRVMVRVVAHDAKVIGSGVGGARVTIRDPKTGKVFASGVQEGSTGSTELIMSLPRERGKAVYSAAGAAGFLAEIVIDRPTTVEIVGEGPLGTPHAIQRATKTMLLLPGEDVLGEGVILELNGFTVVIDSLPEKVRHGLRVGVIARVTMLCGCPFSPGGLWDSNRITVMARIFRDGRRVLQTQLKYAGPGSEAGLRGGRSTFGGWIALDQPGNYEVRVLAEDPQRANFGMAVRTLVVE